MNMLETKKLQQPSSMQKQLDELSTWTTTNDMLLNEKKCVAMHVTFSENPPPAPPLFINGVPLLETSKFRVLGLTVKQDLPWNSQVSVGAVELHPAPDPVELNREMIGHTLEHSADLEAENRRLQEKNQTLRQEQQHILAEALQDTIRHFQQQLDQGVEEQENHRVTGVTVKSKAGDSIKKDQKEEDDLPQSFHPSQAPTVLIRDVSSQTSSMEVTVSDSKDVLPSCKHGLCYPQSPESKVKKPSPDQK
ncbi:unnamed protein product [Coregonus sp. 'balchen']|nr:unnamed protein product [Coregonus sp. 'balchen']